jgi:hypothetical protein
MQTDHRRNNAMRPGRAQEAENAHENTDAYIWAMALRVYMRWPNSISPRLVSDYSSTIERRPNLQQKTTAMQLRSSSLAVLLCTYMSAAFAADAGLLTTCTTRTIGQACKKCVFNDDTLVDVCYKGECGTITSGKRVGWSPCAPT